MKQYKDLVLKVMNDGIDKNDRTGTGTRSIFGHQMRFNLAESFPLVTLKYTSFKMIAAELLWFISGNNHIDDLHKYNCHIWDEWVKDDGTFGPIYGHNWRSWPDTDGGTIDQLQKVINEIKTNPDSRRLLVTAWNPATVDQAVLPPCHVMFQFHVVNNHLSCQIYQRSCDVFLGVPFNIASYALLTHMVAHVCKLGVGELIWTGGDVHIYKNHFEQVAEMLNREPLHGAHFEGIFWGGINTIDDFDINDILSSLVGYEYHPAIKAPVAV